MDEEKSELLKSWHQLLQSGVISEEEFNVKKKEILENKISQIVPKPLPNKSSTSVPKQITPPKSTNYAIPIVFLILIFTGASVFGYLYYQDSQKYLQAETQNYAEVPQIPFNFQNVLNNLSKDELGKSAAIQEWLQNVIEQNNTNVLSKTCKHYVSDIEGMGYDCEGCLSESEIADKWKYIYDDQFSNFTHAFYDGNDYPDEFSVSNLQYLGNCSDDKYETAYFYSTTVSDVGLNYAVNRIFKVIEYENNYYIDGVYNKK